MISVPQAAAQDTVDVTKKVPEECIPDVLLEQTMLVPLHGGAEVSLCRAVQE